jgi:hypothetical protein
VASGPSAFGRPDLTLLPFDPSATSGNDRSSPKFAPEAAPDDLGVPLVAQTFDVNHFQARQESHAAHGKQGRFHMASVSIPHQEKCPRCGSEVVHLEWRERGNAQEVQYLWHCWNCKNEFVTVATSAEKEPSVTEITEPFFTSLLV